MEKWPNFFIVGAAKAGTTSLYEYLKDIPGIYMSPVKEPNYFSQKTMPEEYPVSIIRNKAEYLSLFENIKDEKIIGEATTSYLTDPDAPYQIHKIIPTAQILISLRDPIERAFSHYLMHIQTTWLTSSLSEELKKSSSMDFNPNKPHLKLEHGLYYDSIKRYQNVFGKKQIKIIIFEEFIRNVKDSLEEILKFLNVSYPSHDFQNIIHNPYRGARGGKIVQKIRAGKTLRPIVKTLLSPSLRKSLRAKFIIKKMPKPKMNQDDRDFLVKFYREDVQKVETLLGRKLPWPNFQN